MDEERLAGGNTGGAVRVGDTVRRQAGPWTASVHGLLDHLAAKGFTGSPRALGFDGDGREILSHLPGETVGDRLPWPAWTHSDVALIQVAEWLRALHRAVADYVPPPDSQWREGGSWQPGMVVAHNDAAPYNACWQDGRLVGFFDWDFAAPARPVWDLAFTAFSWVPLHARHVVAAEGFTAFEDRARRLAIFLAAYGYTGSQPAFVQIVQERAAASAEGIVRAAERGDPAYRSMLVNGVERDLRVAIAELDEFAAELG